MLIGDGSNPEWGRTGYSIERISNPLKCGYRIGYEDLRCGHMKPGYLVKEVRFDAR